MMCPTIQEEPESRPGGIPLYVWVVAAVLLAIPVGRVWGEGASQLELLPEADPPRTDGPGGPAGGPGHPECDRDERDPGPPWRPHDGVLPDQHPGRDGDRADIDEPDPSGARGFAERAGRLGESTGPEIDLRPAPGPDPPQYWRALHTEPPRSTGRADPGARDRPGEDPRQPEGAGRDLVPGGRRPPDDQLRGA